MESAQAATPASEWKGKAPMWVFDGEQWTEESGSEQKKNEKQILRYEEFMPELQVIEIVPVPAPAPRNVPFPLP